MFNPRMEPYIEPPPTDPAGTVTIDDVLNMDCPPEFAAAEPEVKTELYSSNMRR